MDSRCKAWKLRNSTEIWRPNKHTSKSINASIGKGKVSTSNGDFNLLAMMRDKEKSSPTKWNSSTTFSQDTSSMSAGNKSPSPILRCRTISPDLCKIISVGTINLSESAPQVEDKIYVTNPHIVAVEEHVVSASPEEKSLPSTKGTIFAVKGLDSQVDTQRLGLSTTSSRATLIAQRGAVSRPASVSPQMWQEKLPITKNTTNRRVVTCKRWKSSQRTVAFGTKNPKKKENEAKNICLPQSLDVFFVPEVSFPSLTSLQRSIVGKRAPSFPIDQMLLPLPQDLEKLQSELLLCSSEAFSNKIISSQETSLCVGDEASMNTHDDLKASSLGSPEQCVMMRINMTYEPGVKPSISYQSDLKENRTEDWKSLTDLETPHKTEMMSTLFVSDTAQSQTLEVRVPSLELEDDLGYKRSCHVLEAAHVVFSSDSSETIKGERFECEVRGTENKNDIKKLEVKFEISEEYLSSLSEKIEEDFDIVEAEVSPCRRRWPKLPPSISEKNHIGRLPTTITPSKSEHVFQESAATFEIKKEDALTHVKYVGFQPYAANKTKKNEGKCLFAELVTAMGSCKDSKKDVSCPIKESTQNEGNNMNRLMLGSSPTSCTNSSVDVSCMSGVVYRRLEKCCDEVVSAFPSKTDSESKIGVSSMKSKRSLERETLDIIEKKRRDENSQRSTAGANEARRSNIHVKVLTKAEKRSTKDMKDSKMEVKEGSDSSSKKSLKMRRTSISRPDDAFLGISKDDSLTILPLTGVEGEASNLDIFYTSGHHFESTNLVKHDIQESHSIGKSKVLEPPRQEASCHNMQEIVAIGNCIEQSYYQISSLERLEEVQIKNDPSSGICNNTHAQDPSEVIPPKEENLISNGISKMWSNPLHRDNESPDRSSLSSEKISSILSYLGHVEESNMRDNFKLLQKRDIIQEGAFRLKGRHSPCTVLEHEDSVSLANSTFTPSLTNLYSNQSRDGEVGISSTTSLFEGVRKKMQEFKAIISTKEYQNAQLLEDMERLKVDRDQTLSLERDRFGRELEVRAAEYKAAIQHHLALNEKMIKDKEALSQKCCNLAGILSTIESKNEDKMKVLKEQFVQELKKQKEIWIAGEKPRREAWKEKKIKQIKELTIKGLEPHIDGLNDKHKHEIKRLEMRYADDTQKRVEAQVIQHRQEMCELRHRILKEQDEILEKERLAALTRLSDVAEKYEHQAIELRRKFSNDMAVELEKMEEIRRKDKQIAHEMLSRAREEWNDREGTLKNSIEKCIQEAGGEKDAQIRSLRSELKKIKNDWQKDFEEALRVQEDEFKLKCTKERDEQIEMIIERMEKEKDEAISQHTEELLAKLETLMEEKLELMKKVKEVEFKCANLCKVSLEVRQKAEMETANKNMQVESLRREVFCQVDLIEEIKAQIQKERRNLKEQENHYELRLANVHELVQTAQLEVERCNLETQQLRLKKVKELEEVEIHVRQAIENKDQIIAEVREQLMAAREQIRHTELLLQQEHITFLADPD